MEQHNTLKENQEILRVLEDKITCYYCGYRISNFTRSVVSDKFICNNCNIDCKDYGDDE